MENAKNRMLNSRAYASTIRSAGARRRNQGHWELTALLSPALIYVLIFSYLPMVGLIVAFKDYKYNLGIFGSHWIGLSNFKYVFLSNDFYTILRNTLCYNLVFIVLGVIFGISVALMLEIVTKKHVVKVLQSCMFLPYFLSWIVVSYISYAFLDINVGIINRLLQSLGMNKISFYSEPAYWPFILTAFNVWKGVGFGSLVYYGALLGISPELYEAGALDGCSYLQRIWHITLPELRQTMIILVLMSLGGIFRSDYGLFYYLPKDLGALYSTTDVIDTYILRALRISGSVGGASAVGFLQSVVGFAVVLTANTLVKKIESDSALF